MIRITTTVFAYLPYFHTDKKNERDFTQFSLMESFCAGVRTKVVCVWVCVCVHVCVFVWVCMKDIKSERDECRVRESVRIDAHKEKSFVGLSFKVYLLVAFFLFLAFIPNFVCFFLTFFRFYFTYFSFFLFTKLLFHTFFILSFFLSCFLSFTTKNQCSKMTRVVILMSGMWVST